MLSLELLAISTSRDKKGKAIGFFAIFTGMLREIDVMARLSGDEFFLLLEGVNDRENVKINTEKAASPHIAPVV